MGQEVEDWLQFKRQTARSTSGASDRARRADLQAWADILSKTPDQTEPSLDIAQLDVRSVLAAVEQMRSEYAEATVQRRLSTIRSYSRWCALTGLVSADPLSLLVVSSRLVPTGDVKALTRPQIEQLFEVVGVLESRITNPARDGALLEVLAGTGVRAQELCGLRARDVLLDLEHPLLQIVHGTKSGHPREVPLPRSAVSALTAHLETHSAEHLFNRTNGKRFEYAHLTYLLTSYFQAAGVVPPEGALAHAFRHHYGLELARRGIPATMIQQLLGHSDVRTTATYTRAFSSNLVAALADAGWL